ncbi:MAG: hypothetical protein GF416_07965 [Candidatus Altiarchaeales archaeon]|nr:hypothetical protein [Candidatus Altiarchaeales archaeon]MBD3417049.1 hypothetical protein [Candidatus Altiarchaeales archaeon]
MKALHLTMILCLMASGCILAEKKEAESCPEDYMLVAGSCCLDYDHNGLCDTEDAVRDAGEYLSSKCRPPEMPDPRHPEYCCVDADGDKECDYMKDLL